MFNPPLRPYTKYSFFILSLVLLKSLVALNTSDPFICFAPENAEAFTKEGTAPVEADVCEQQLRSRKSKRHLATLSQRDADIVNLFMREGVQAEILLIPNPSKLDAKLSPLPRVMVTLFRTRELEKEWIHFMQEQSLYLQDPLYTKLDLPYWNPQRFYNEDKIYTSSFWQRHEDGKSRKEEISPVDFLAAFTSERVLTETEGSKLLRTPLQSHQKGGLTFMLNREQGWNLKQDGADIWSLKWDEDGQSKYFVNNIDLTERLDPPPQFSGGILADGMGSGKTLSMISLIAHDIAARNNRPQLVINSCILSPAQSTLVVMPPHVLRTWEKELLRHFRPENVSWRCHHGTMKLTSESEIAKFDIVLITYPTLASEWRHRSSSAIFRHSWRRLVLDEGHSIKDPTTNTAKAACALKSDRRWVVTGTPIQNRLSELASLFQFLRVYPYSNRKTFDECITRIWSSGQAQLALERLKRLLNFTMLRRSQKGLNLPGKTNLKVFLDFDDQERAAYNAARDKTMKSIDDLINPPQSSESYLNALQKINSLRLICNLGVSAAQETLVTPHSLLFAKKTAWDESRARQSVVSLTLAGVPMICANCAITIDTLFGGNDELVSLQVTKCIRIWCPSCYDNFADSKTQRCTCTSGCSSVALNLSALQMSPSDTLQPSVNEKFPTKIRHLVRDLEKHSVNEKSIVFSYFKTTLDLAHFALDKAGISCVQVDGRLKPKERERHFHDFTHKQSIRVLLLSLSCGSSGLTLTAASRVYLMEPQWNPSTEEQALARVYRIGQTRDVTTIRYILDNSIEKYVVAVQDGKKDLITLLLSTPTSTTKICIITARQTAKYAQELKSLL
ncbi:hypothetical protein NUW58_g4621 [Xylaria curta]|uniref:Uncharacterized protein n=1 Tax=Xylaria curta TaxID=42375 RepID=A0ACC1P5K5_9PEZI|nr:hypothetical protein NUW58_g4621 [Xylaria curta]